MTLFIRERARIVTGLAVALLAVATSAAAQERSSSTAGQASPNAVPVGDTTRALLDIQRNGTQAGAMPPLTGEQAALGYARYMNSFNHALPAFFTSQATGSALRGGAGGQSGSGLASGLFNAQ